MTATPNTPNTPITLDEIRDTVRSRYGAAAQRVADGAADKASC